MVGERGGRSWPPAAPEADKQGIESGLTLEDILVRVRLFNHATERSMAQGSKLAYGVAKHQGWMSQVRAQLSQCGAPVANAPCLGRQR